MFRCTTWRCGPVFCLPRRCARCCQCGGGRLRGAARRRVRYRARAVLYAVLMASSSAALTLPVLDAENRQRIGRADRGSDRHCGCRLYCVAALGDRPANAGRARASVTGAAMVLFVALRAFERSGRRKRFNNHRDHDEAPSWVQPDPAVSDWRRWPSPRTVLSVMLAVASRWSGGQCRRRTAPVGLPTVRHHRGFQLRPAVLRLARRLVADPRASGHRPFIVLPSRWAWGRSSPIASESCWASRWRWLRWPPRRWCAGGRGHHRLRTTSAAGREASALILGALVTIAVASVASRLMAPRSAWRGESARRRWWWSRRRRGAERRQARPPSELARPRRGG